MPSGDAAIQHVLLSANSFRAAGVAAPYSHSGLLQRRATLVLDEASTILLTSVGVASIYPTIHNNNHGYGLAVYDVRNNQLFPTANNRLDSFGLAVFEIRGTSVYPTVNNKHYGYGLAAFDVRGTQLYPTASNKLDAYGLPVFEIR